MFIGAGLGPRLTGALTGLGFGGILRVVAAALVLGVLPALPALRHHRTQKPGAGQALADRRTRTARPPPGHRRPRDPPHGTGLLPTPGRRRGDGPA
ncbi:hypothetical protein ACIOHS_32055 [Streptomyces sp. NPDC088253]|uniref:hypothetical protein n=1 Tax=Streptomyces sp. NPDC088253 TaxID=3365846 RepID=UPI0037F95FAD